jgi:CBS domain-containing protein
LTSSFIKQLKIKKMKVKEIMTEGSLQYCSPETKLHNAAKSMKTANCGALPVVDKNKKVVGMITDRDICLSLANKQEKPLSRQNVGDIISSKVYSVKTDDDLNTALKQMRTNKIGRLPVVDKAGKLKGILSLHDLLSRFLNGDRELKKVSEAGENISKTLKALADNYSLNSQTKIVTAGRSESWEDAM